RKTVPARPAFCASAKFRSASFEFVFEKFSHTVAHFCGEPKLFAASVIIFMRLQFDAGLVRITAQKLQSGLAQLGSLLLQIVEEIHAEVFRTNLTLPPRDDLTRMRPDQHTRIQ